MNQRRFGKLWDDYMTKVLPPNAGSVQRQETRRAFYAGGIALFTTIVSMLEDGTEPTEEDLRAMDGLQVEFDAYARDLAEGRA